MLPELLWYSATERVRDLIREAQEEQLARALERSQRLARVGDVEGRRYRRLRLWPLL